MLPEEPPHWQAFDHDDTHPLLASGVAASAHAAPADTTEPSSKRPCVALAADPVAAAGNGATDAADSNDAAGAGSAEADDTEEDEPEQLAAVVAEEKEEEDEETEEEMATDAGTEEDETVPVTLAAPAASQQSLAHKTVVFTGMLQMPRAEAIAAATAAGATVGRSVGGKTDIFVAGETPGSNLPSSKLEAARAKGVDVWTEAQFVAAAAAAADADADADAAAASSTTDLRPAASVLASSSSEDSLGPLADGESKQVAGSGSNVYTVKRTGAVYSCSCPAWRNQGGGGAMRTCKHVKGLRGEEAERARLGDDSKAFNASGTRVAGGGGGGGGSGGGGGGGGNGGGANSELAASVTLAKPWDGASDVAGWLMSEKLDGMRALWDGEHTLWSRAGNPVYAPDFVLQARPVGTALAGAASRL